MKELGINRSTQTHTDTQIRDEKKGKNSKKPEYEWETRAIVQSGKKNGTKQEPKGNTAFQSESSASPEVLTLRTKSFELMMIFFSSSLN